MGGWLRNYKIFKSILLFYETYINKDTLLLNKKVLIILKSASAISINLE